MLKNLLDFQLIDIVSTQSPVASSHFSTDEIEALANNFLKAGGNIHPLIVKRVGVEDFEVVEGHLEFYAAKRAREINKYFEMVRAIILDKKNQDDVLEQFNSLTIKNTTISTIASGTESNLTELFTNLEKTLSKSVDELRVKLEVNTKVINQLITTPDRQSLLDKFNYLEEYQLAQELDRKGGFSQNEAQKLALLIVAERQNGDFSSLLEVVDRVRKETKRRERAISEKSMIKLVDSWSRSG